MKDFIDGPTTILGRYNIHSDNKDKDEDFLGTNEIEINRNPLWNCQTYSIGGIQDLISGINNVERITDELKQIQKQIGKNQILIDINDNKRFSETIETIFPKECIIFKKRYVNGTKSHMIMYLIKTDILR
jgi:hypothetical protein